MMIRSAIGRATRATVIGIPVGTLLFLVGVTPAFAQTSPTGAEWSGKAQCQLTVQNQGYTLQETQTWTITPGAPTLQGAIQVYPGTWSVTGQGNVQRPGVASQWTTNVAPMNAPIGIFIRASDNRLIVQARHSQLVSQSGTVIKQATGAQTNFGTSEWSFPQIEDAPNSSSISGMGTVVVGGSLSPMQLASVSSIANCTWQFSKSSATTAVAQTPNELSWPQKFDVVAGEPSSFAFVASQPGPISVTVQSQGAPITVSLSGPLTQPVEKSGTGTVKLDYAATVNDVGRGSLWHVQIRAQNTPANVSPVPQPVITQNQPRTPVTARLPVVASGTVSVMHPLGDLAKAKTELAARVSTIPKVAQAGTTGQQLLDQRKAQYLQAVAAAQASQQQQVAKLFPTRTTVSSSVLQTQRVAATRPAAGVIGGSTEPTPPPTPPSFGISSLSAAHGQPGDSIVITGSAFGENICAIQAHFVVNPGMDLIDYLSYNGYYACDDGVPIGNQLTVKVPAFSGVTAYDGQVYLTLNGQKSASLPFHFEPTLDFVQLAPPCNAPDAKIANVNFQCPFWEPPDWDNVITIHDGIGIDPPLTGDFLGHKGEDLFYPSMTLKNGWVVDSVSILSNANPSTIGSVTTCCNASYVGNGSNAYVLISTVGSPSPFVDVHWWTDAFSRVQYQLYVTIKGPLGVPYQ